MDLVNRLRHYMDTSQVTISQFADKCGIPRPTMSQLINGRNKRISDEVINKIHNAYPDLSILWLMFGEGEMTLCQNMAIPEAQNDIRSDKIPGNSAVNQEDITHKTPDRAFTDSVQTSDSFENLLFESPKTGGSTAKYASSSEEAFSKENILFDSEESQSTNSSSSFRNTTCRTTSTSPIAPNDITRTLRASSPAPNTQTKSVQEDSITTNGEKRISISPDARKKITNIVVFYSDNSFQSFLPDA